jgi:hypothetical protein
VELSAVREVSIAVNLTHRFIYLVPEAAQEAAAVGLADSGPAGPAYFAFRSAAMGTVPWQVVLACFYNWHGRAVQPMSGVWDVASPGRWQAARFRAACRALQRVGVDLTHDNVAEARSLIDPVVAGGDYAGKPLAAANASVALPSDPLTALWQQITVLREWRGDAHIIVLAGNRLGPCECNVIHTATGRFPTAVARATRGWSDEEWAAASARLATRGWLDADGRVTDTGAAAREQIEVETDQHCAALWEPIGNEGARRIASLITKINDAFTTAGTYSQFRGTQPISERRPQRRLE